MGNKQENLHSHHFDPTSAPADVSHDPLVGKGNQAFSEGKLRIPNPQEVVIFHGNPVSKKWKVSSYGRDHGIHESDIPLTLQPKGRLAKNERNAKPKEDELLFWKDLESEHFPR